MDLEQGLVRSDIIFTWFLLQVCIHHFKEDDIERTYTYNDGLRTVTVARDRITLKTAVPGIFPNCPSYLSEWNSKPNRQSLDDKERLQMESA